MSSSQTRKRGKILAARFADAEAEEIEAKARAPLSPLGIQATCERWGVSSSSEAIGR